MIFFIRSTRFSYKILYISTRFSDFLCHFLGNCLGRLCVVVCVVFSVVNDYLHKNKIQQDLRFLCQISLIKHRFGKKVRHRVRHFTSFFSTQEIKIPHIYQR